MAWLKLVTHLFCYLVISYADKHVNTTEALFTNSSLQQLKESGDQIDWSNLNYTFKPTHYQIELQVILNDEQLQIHGNEYKNTAPGKVSIFGHALQPTKLVVLQVNQLLINTSSVKVFSVSKEKVTRQWEIRSLHNIPKYNQYVIVLAHELKPLQEIRVDIEYLIQVQSNFKTKSKGEKIEGILFEINRIDNARVRATKIMHSNGIDDSGAILWHTETHVFPCVHEFMSTFELNVTRGNNYTSLFSSRLQRSIIDPTNKHSIKDVFGKTIKLYPNQVSLLLLDDTFYKREETTFGSGKPMNVFVPNTKTLNRFVFNQTANILKFLNEFFEDDERFSKMDFVAANEFSSAWTVIQSDEFYMQELKSESKKVEFLFEMAKMLGWELLGHTAQLSENIHGGIQSFVVWRAVESTKAVSNEALNRIAFMKLVTSLTYDVHPDTLPTKHFTILKMIEESPLRNTLRKAIKLYHTKIWEKATRQFGTTYYDDTIDKDFYDSLQEVQANDTVKKRFNLSSVIQSWTNQQGFPLVRVNRVNQTCIEISHEVFRKSGKSQGDNASWYIPVTILAGNKTDLVWLGPNTKSATVHTKNNESSWLIVDSEGKGYYRVIYDKSLLTDIVAQMEFDPNTLNEYGRSKLLNNYFNFIKEDYGNIQTAMNLTRYLNNEKSLLVWTTFNMEFAQVLQQFTFHPDFPLLQKYLREKYEAVIRDENITTAFESQFSNEKKVKPVSFFNSEDLNRLFSQACKVNTPTCSKYARKLFEIWKSNLSANPCPEFANMECTIVQVGGREAVDFVLGIYNNSLNASPRDTYERLKLIKALPCVNDIELVRELLNKTVNTSIWREDPGNGLNILSALFSNPLAIAQADLLEFLSTNIDFVLQHETRSYIQMELLENLYVPYINTKAGLEKLKQFIDQHWEKLISSQEWLDRVVMKVNDNIAWMKKNADDLSAWLRKAAQ